MKVGAGFLNATNMLIISKKQQHLCISAAPDRGSGLSMNFSLLATHRPILGARVTQGIDSPEEPAPPPVGPVPRRRTKVASSIVWMDLGKSQASDVSGRKMEQHGGSADHFLRDAGLAPLRSPKASFHLLPCYLSRFISRDRRNSASCRPCRRTKLRLPSGLRSVPVRSGHAISIDVHCRSNGLKSAVDQYVGPMDLSTLQHAD